MSGFGIIPCQVYAVEDAYAIAVYAVLARHANQQGECWPSVATIAGSLHVGVSTVKRALAKLRSAGVVATEQRFAQGMKQANAYRLVFHNSANVRIVPTEPSIVPTEPMDGSHRTDGWSPENHKQDSIEQDSIEQDVPPSSPPVEEKPKRATGVPKDFEITDHLRQQAVGYGVPPERIVFETDNFLDHHRSKGSTFKDWPAAWRKWMRNAATYAVRSPTPKPNGPPPTQRGTLPTGEEMLNTWKQSGRVK